MKLRIKTGDTVKVIAGKDSGKTGKVTQTFPALNRIVVEGVNACKRHMKTRKQGEKGQVLEFFMPIHASNVQVLAEDGLKKTKAKKTTSTSDDKKSA